MLSKQMFTADYIQELHSRTGNDPVLLERVIYAFGLLEALKKVGLPFCFKGGTSLIRGMISKIVSYVCIDDLLSVRAFRTSAIHSEQCISGFFAYFRYSVG